MSKSRTSLFVIGILIAMIAASLLTVLGLYLAGALATNPVELEFSVNAVAPKEYDGVPLRANGYSWDAGELKKGHTLSVKVLGEQLNSGSSESDLSVKVYDEKERDVTNEYSIKVNKTLLTVTRRPLSIFLEPQQIAYSGSEVPIENYKLFKDLGIVMITPDLEEGELIAGHRLVVSFPGRFENVGDTIPAVDEWQDENFIIYDNAGNDVTRNYQLEEGMTSSGTIEIVPRKLSVKALDVSKPFDGTPVQGKFELVEGTLAAGHYIGSVEYTDERGDKVSVVKVGSARVKVGSITVCKQEGYGLVPLDEDLQKNYELNLSPSLYGVMSVTKRPVTVRALNMTKSYDGAPLASILAENEAPFKTDLPAGFRVDSYYSVLSSQTDVCDKNYSIESITVKEADATGAELTDQFEYSFIPAIAKITPVTVSLSLVRSGYSDNYTGAPITIYASYAFQNFDGNIEKSIEEGEIQSPCRDMLQSLQASDFSIQCSQTVRDAGFYEFGAELREEVLAAKFNKKGNVIFEITSGLFEVNRVNLSIEYLGGSGAATDKIEKIYDGREVELDYRNLRVTDAEGLVVSSADFRYINESGEQDFNDHTTVNDYLVKISRIHVTKQTNTEEGSVAYEDVTANYNISDYSISVSIKKKNIYATAGQSYATRYVNSYPSNSEGNQLAGELEESYRTSITFSGLSAGDSVSYDEDSFTLSGSYDSRSRLITFYVEFERGSRVILNSQGVDVTNCYNLVNAEETVITVELVETGA